MRIIKYLTPITSILIIINLFILYFIKPTLSMGVFLGFILLIDILIFIKGIFFNKKEIYQNNINKYLIIYFIMIIFMTLIYQRNIDNRFIIHIIPGHLIRKFLRGDFTVTIFTLIYNYLGNLGLFIPFTILLILKDKKYLDYKRMFIIILSITLGIEIIQGITGLGEFDIDDIILNVLGGMLTLFLILKYKLFPKMRKFFNTNFNLRKETITLLYIFNIIIIIIYNYLTFTI